VQPSLDPRAGFWLLAMDEVREHRTLHVLAACILIRQVKTADITRGGCVFSSCVARPDREQDWLSALRMMWASEELRERNCGRRMRLQKLPRLRISRAARPSSDPLLDSHLHHHHLVTHDPIFWATLETSPAYVPCVL
jgi:hypothetical protein